MLMPMAQVNPQQLAGVLGGDAVGLPEALVRISVFFAAYLAFTAVQWLFARHPLLRGIRLQVNLLAMALLGLLVLKAPLLNRLHPRTEDGFRVAVVFLGIMIGLKLVDFFLFELRSRGRAQPPVPIVVRDIGRWVLSLIALVLVVRGFFPDANLNVLAVSSLVVGYIVGNATQDTLGNLIAGLALNTERPFQLGDWVSVGGHTGQVVDTTWRATRLRTKDEDYVVIPNSSIAREHIINYSRPTRCHGCRLTIGVDYESSPDTVRQAILGVLRDAPDVLQTPPPSVFLSGYGDFSMNFSVKFYIEEFARADSIQSTIMDRIWYAFKRAAVGIPYPIQDVRVRNAAAEERRLRTGERAALLDLLRGVELLHTLSPAELETVAAAARVIPFAPGEILCRQNEPGDSFYIIRAGHVNVAVATADGRSVPVAQLGPGGFFGEMSLLTGEPRTATVTAEGDVDVLCLSKQNFAAILQANAGLAGRLAAVLEKREGERQARLSSGAPAPVADTTQIALAERIRRFFGLA